MSELKPCPFCGHAKPRAMKRLSGFIYCMGDDCDAEMRADSDADAIRMWNTRIPHPGRC